MNKRLVFTERVQNVLYCDWYTHTDEVSSRQFEEEWCQKWWCHACRRLAIANMQLSKFSPCKPRPWSDPRAKKPTRWDRGHSPVTYE